MSKYVGPWEDKRQDAWICLILRLDYRLSSWKGRHFTCLGQSLGAYYNCKQGFAAMQWNEAASTTQRAVPALPCRRCCLGLCDVPRTAQKELWSTPWSKDVSGGKSVLRPRLCHWDSRGEARQIRSFPLCWDFSIMNVRYAELMHVFGVFLSLP